MKHPLLLTALAAGFTTLVVGTASADTIYVTENGGNDIAEINGDTVTTFGSGYVDNPTGLAFNSAGDLFVANTGNGTVTEFNSTGGYLGTVATGLVAPRGLAIDSSGNVYIANQATGVITKLTDDAGTYVSSTYATGLTTPNGITIDATGNLYVTNGVPGNYISEITTGGQEVTMSNIGEQLNGPNGITFGPDGDLYVVNRITSDVEKITLQGIGSTYLTDASLNNPKNLVFDSEGDVYITDSGNDTVTEYNASGQLINTFTGISGACFITSSDSDTLPVPEPSTYAMLLGGAAALYFLHRRRALAGVRI